MNQSFVIWGGYGGHNIGDEAILWAMSRLIRKSRPMAKQYVLLRGDISENVAAQYRLWEIEPVRFPSFRSLKVLRTARLIAGGGHLVHDMTLVWPVGWTSLVLLLSRIFGQYPLVLCIGADPVKRPIIAAMIKYFYSLASICTCRDVASSEVLTSVGVPQDKVCVTRDVAFALDGDILPSWVANKDGPPRITVVITHDSRTAPGESRYYSELIQSLLDVGCTVRLIAHDLRPGYDLGLLLRIEAEHMANPRVTSCKPQRVTDVLEVYASSDAVISSRMHPLILAALVGSLPIAILRTEKVRSLTGDLGVPILSESEVSGSRGKNTLTLLSGRDAFLRAIAVQVDAFRFTVERTTLRALTREGESEQQA